MDNKYKKLSDDFKAIKRELFEESKLKYPSVNTLERAANSFIILLKNASIEDDGFKTWADWKIRYTKIFIVDLTGELEHDYEKRNARYYQKWKNQERILNEYFGEFQIKFHDELNKDI
ncbi:MAG: hypothetical protein M0D53_12495 [Flavobacterium sp. JAD_PAG50586_2]|nr:MAG: hypothetical protein M0D53_12495 [Flavobacterium sp. JAD_PAG50586_2]